MLAEKFFLVLEALIKTQQTNADGSVRVVTSGVSHKTWKEALTPAGGEVLGPDW